MTLLFDRLDTVDHAWAARLDERLLGMMVHLEAP